MQRTKQLDIVELKIMALDNIENILEITSNLGDGYKSVLETVDTTDNTDALYCVAQARQHAMENMAQNEYDYAAPLLNAFRAVEKTLDTSIQVMFNSVCLALDKYSKAVYSGKSFRVKWDSTAPGVNNPFFTPSFRRLWRDAMDQELIVKIGTVTKASSIWANSIVSVYELDDVVAATASILPNTPAYANGTLGVGATLTASTDGALGDIDSVTVQAGDRILVKNQAAALQNGIYVVTSIGSSGAKWMLTRATDADTSSATEVSYGMSTYVQNGSVNGSKKFYMSNSAAITMGTTSLNFTQTTLQSISLNESLEIRAVAIDGSATTNEITATITVQKSDLSTSLETIIIPAGTTSGKGFLISSTGVDISHVLVTGGADGDTLEFWVSGASDATSPQAPTDEIADIYLLPLYTLQDDRVELQALIDGSVAGTLGSHTTVNITSKSVYACPGQLNPQGLKTYVNMVGDSTGTAVTIVCGNIIPDTCIFPLHSSDRFYNRFGASVRSKIKVVPLTAMGISMGAMFTSNLGPADAAERATNEPIVMCLNGRAMTIACDSQGLNNWRVISGLGANVYRDITSLTEINGTHTFITPENSTDVFAFIANTNYSTRVMKFSSITSSTITFDQAPLLYSGATTLLNSKVKFYNAPEFLTEYGEYFVSFETGRVYFIPWDGEIIARLSVSTPYGEWSGTNRAGAVFDLSCSRTNATDFTGDRYNNIEGIVFEACYNTPLRLGRYTKAKRIQVNGSRWSGIASLNPHNIEISDCIFNDIWRMSLDVIFSQASYQLSQTTFVITGTDPSRTSTVNTVDVFANATYTSVLIEGNDIERNGIIWHDTPAMRINALGVTIRDNYITYTSSTALALGAQSESNVYHNYFQYCNQSLTEGGVIYGGRAWTQRAVIYENAFANIRRVRSGFGEDFLTCIMWDDMAAGLYTYDNYIINSDYGIQINSGQSEHNQNIFDNVPTSYVFISFYSFGSTTPSSYTTTSLRGAGALSNLVGLNNHPSFNILTHPVFASEQPGVLCSAYLAAVAAATDPGTPGDGTAVLARKMTQGVIDAGLNSAVANGANGNYMLSQVNVVYNAANIRNGSGTPTPPGISVGVNITTDSPYVSYWSVTPTFKYAIAP